MKGFKVNSVLQAEITKLLMEGLSQSQTNHLRHLKAFVSSQVQNHLKWHQSVITYHQVEYYAQAHLVMQDLNRELER